MHHQARGVGVLAELFPGELPRHFCGVWRKRQELLAGLGEPQRLVECGLVLCIGEKPGITHATQDVALSLGGAFGVDHRVEPGGRFGQAREHRRLPRAQFGEGLAEVGLRGRREAIGALAEKNLIDVELEDLFFTERFLDP